VLGEQLTSGPSSGGGAGSTLGSTSSTARSATPSSLTVSFSRISAFLRAPGSLSRRGPSSWGRRAFPLG